MRRFPTLIHQLLDALMLFPAVVPDGTNKLGLCPANTVPQAPDLVIWQVFDENRAKLSAGQSQVTSLSNYLTGCVASSPSRSDLKRMDVTTAPAQRLDDDARWQKVQQIDGAS
jgi:hypothetical protein